MKTLQNIAFYSVIALVSIGAGLLLVFHIHSIQRSVNALEQAAEDIRIIRMTLNPASAMRGAPAPEKITETDIQL